MNPKMKFVFQLQIISQCKTIYIISQRKAFCRERISKSSCARKEIVDIAILLEFRNGDRNIMESYLSDKETFHENEEVEAGQLVQMNIYQSNTYTKDLSWPHFIDDPRVQERQQVLVQQSYIPVPVTYLVFQLEVLTQTWHQYSMQGWMVDLQR